MYMNKPSNTPSDDRDILIAFEEEGYNQFISGFYDANENDYYTWDGEMIEMSYIIAWDEKPTIEFL